MHIRRIAKDDNKILAKLIRSVFEEHHAPTQGTVYSDPTTDKLFELFQREGSVLWVAEDDGRIAGCCGVYPTDGLPKHCAELVKFYIQQISRGKGIGKALMEHCMQFARQKGYTQLYLESLPDFSTAVQLYKKLGFIQLDQPLGASGHSTCNIWMIKDLM